MVRAATRRRSVRTLRPLLLGAFLVLGGCGYATREHYYSPNSASRERGPVQGSGESASVVHAAVGPSRAVFDAAGVRLTIGPEIREGHLLAIGPIIPIIPAFLFRWIGGSRHDQEKPLALSIRVVPGQRQVHLDVGRLTLSVAGKGPRTPTQLAVTPERSPRDERPAGYVGAMDWSAGAPHMLEFGPEPDATAFRVTLFYEPEPIESFDIEWSGIKVDSTVVDSIRVSFAKRMGWKWGVVGP